MTYLELTKPRKYKYGGFYAASPELQIVNEQFVPDSLKSSWEQFKKLIEQNSELAQQNYQQNQEFSDFTYQPEQEFSNNDLFETEDNILIDSPKENISFQQLLKEENIDARVTSAYRAGAITSNGSRSHHSNKSNPAIDIVPANGKSYDELIIQLITNPRILKYFKDNNWGIHSEVSKSQWNSLTTGSHLHIGPDNVAKKGLTKILEKYNSGNTTNLWNYNLA